jgi:hypothetical protein
MTAAPLSMVAMRMSWPGQSTKETCRCSFHTFPSSSNTSGAEEPLALLFLLVLCWCVWR